MSLSIPTLLSFLVLASNAVFIIVAALFLFSSRARAWMIGVISRHGMWFLFALSAGATLGSLTLSNVVGFLPCDLCWFQRLFMYPQAIISLVFLVRQKSGQISQKALYWLLSLSVIGAGIALFHSYTQWGGTHTLLPCTLDGGACGKLYIYAYNYITIPFMSLSMFTYIISVLLVALYARRTNVVN